MNHNHIKIVCNPTTNHLEYQFQDEQSVWQPISKYSDLSKKQYTHTTLRQSASAIISVISTIYNPAKRGVEIIYEGSEQEYAILQKTIQAQYSSEGIICQRRALRIAVAGKIGSGKSTLIEAIINKRGMRTQVSKEADYTVYKEVSGDIEWYEINGIDLGVEKVNKVEETINTLSEKGLTTFIYCTSSDRIEQIEKRLIDDIRAKYPALVLIGILTNSASEQDAIAAEEIGQMLGLNVFPVLAKPLKTRHGEVPVSGLEQIIAGLFGG